MIPSVPEGDTPALNLCRNMQIARGDAEDGPLLAPNFVNFLSLTGIAAGLAWAFGGPSWMSIYGLFIDEIDGSIARATKTESEAGSQIDWIGDITVSSVTLLRLEAPALIPPLLAGQVYFREKGMRPVFGSARAVVSLYALAMGK